MPTQNATPVLLAHAPEAVVDEVLGGELVPFTPNTEARPEHVRRILMKTRRSGFHVTLEDLDDRAFSIAAPVRDHSEQVVAAVSIAGPVSRLTPTTERTHVELVLRAAQEISRGLGMPVREEQIA